MDYKRIYDELISHRQSNQIKSGYTENHHIQMSSLGGSDHKSNLVRLTAREHYIAHLLLARFDGRGQTINALWMMQCKSKFNDERPVIKTSRMYEWARKEFIKYISKNAKVTSKGERNSQHGTRWICNIELQENKKISNTDELPDGWVLGRNKWKEKKKKLKGYKLQSAIKDANILKIQLLKEKYKQTDSLHNLFKEISSKENISVRTLYNYWGCSSTGRAPALHA